MNQKLEKELENVNKLIFVKRYSEAEDVLQSIVNTDEGRLDLFVHLRLIELAAMLKKLQPLKDTYLNAIKNNQEMELNEICLAFVEQHGEMVSPTESVNAFQEIMKVYGPSAAAFYGIGYSLEIQGSFERALYNYDQAVKIDPDWYLAYFGMSQIHYNNGNEKRGDHFFYLFEQHAPYNVYGNFETHRKLYTEFLDSDRFTDAEAAIHTLSEWWIDNRGVCPSEIQIFELLSTAKISLKQGDVAQADSRKSRAKGLALQVLEDDSSSEGMLFFIAKILEEYGENETAFLYYKAILKRDASDPEVVQKIGSQFLSLGEYDMAKELFQEAYNSHPNNPDVRFCLLVSQLKMADVNVEEYLIGRERLRQLLDAGGDKVELLALLHSLMAKFDKDSDVQGHVGDVYLKLGNTDRASRHFETMYSLDSLCRSTALKYAAFLMQFRDPEEAHKILEKIDLNGDLTREEESEIFWLKANYHARRQNHRESQNLLRKVVAMDPWNISYITQEILNLSQMSKLDENLKNISQIAEILNSPDEPEINWDEFDRTTRDLEKAHAYELSYSRRKLRYLYSNGSLRCLHHLVISACRFDAGRGTNEFMKLLNTNFDSANIYWALGIMFKELWQLETACMWFEQVLMYPSLDNETESKAYMELADCYIWRGINYSKSIEFAKLSLELGDKKNTRCLRILAHAYLKSGQIRQAKIYLDQTDRESDPEARFLHGLFHYRNGARGQANTIWKPLLTYKAESLRFHNIKQEILRFYFDGDPYMKAN